jgi:hypothetical protein
MFVEEELPPALSFGGNWRRRIRMAMNPREEKGLLLGASIICFDCLRVTGRCTELPTQSLGGVLLMIENVDPNNLFCFTEQSIDSFRFTCDITVIAGFLLDDTFPC